MSVAERRREQDAGRAARRRAVEHLAKAERARDGALRRVGLITERRFFDPPQDVDEVLARAERELAVLEADVRRAALAERSLRRF